MTRMTTGPRKLFIFCGEPSADQYGLRVVRHLRSLDPELEIHGVGSFLFKEAGVTLFRDNEDLAVTGFLEVFKNYPKFKSLLDQVTSFISDNQFDGVLLIDYPGFNLRLASRIRQSSPNTKIFYYVAPQVWAWGRHRLVKMKSLVDHLFVILPFELPLFQDAGISTEFVGHPLLDVIDHDLALHDIQAFCQRENVVLKESSRPVIAFLPGSRRNEIFKIFPVYLETMILMKTKMPEAQFIVSAANADRRREITQLFSQKASSLVSSVSVYLGDLNQLLSIADFAFVTSGTATLQTAIHGVPMAVVYKLNILSYWYIKNKLSIPWISLPNVISGKNIVAEFLQQECNAQNLTQYCVNLLKQNLQYIEARKSLEQFKELLGNRGASETVAKKIIRLISG